MTHFISLPGLCQSLQYYAQPEIKGFGQLSKLWLISNVIPHSFGEFVGPLSDCSLSIVHYPMSNDHYPMSNVYYPMSNVQLSIVKWRIYHNGVELGDVSQPPDWQRWFHLRFNDQLIKNFMIIKIKIIILFLVMLHYLSVYKTIWSDHGHRVDLKQNRQIVLEEEEEKCTWGKCWERFLGEKLMRQIILEINKWGKYPTMTGTESHESSHIKHQLIYQIMWSSSPSPSPSPTSSSPSSTS